MFKKERIVLVKKGENKMQKHKVVICDDEKIISEMKCVLKETKRKDTEPSVVADNVKNMSVIKVSQIEYIEKSRHGSIIVINPELNECSYKEKLKADKKLEEIYENVKEYGFIYAHNGYIVNMKYVMKLMENEVCMSDGTRLGISRSKTKEFKERVFEYYVVKNRGGCQF